MRNGRHGSSFHTFLRHSNIGHLDGQDVVVDVVDVDDDDDAVDVDDKIMQILTTTPMNGTALFADFFLRSELLTISVTRIKSPNVYKSCPNMISLEK